MKGSRRAAVLLLAGCFSFLMGACGPSAGNPANSGGETAGSDPSENSSSQAETPLQDVTLTWWVTNTVTADEQKLPQDQWYITQCIKRFEEQNPGVHVEFTLQTDGMQTLQDFKASVVAGNGPDVVELFSGPNMLSVSEGLLPLNNYISDEDWENIVGWNTVAEDMDEEKTIFAYPYPSQSAVMLGYNKDMTAECGYDLEANPPQTIEELEEIFEALKAKGYLPLHSDESFPTTFYYIFAYGWVCGTGTDGIYAHTAEKISYLDDQPFLDMVTKYHDYYTRGFFNEDAATSSDGINVFLQKGCAFYPVGVWDFSACTEALGSSFDILPTPAFQEGFEPGIVGGIGSGLSVANYSENPDMAVKLIQHITSKEELIDFYQVAPGVPMRTDVTVEEIGLADDPLYTKTIDLRANIVYWADNVMSAEAASTFSQFANQVLVGNMTVEDLARQMDESQQ